MTNTRHYRFLIAFLAAAPLSAQTLQWARQFAGTRPNTINQVAADSTGVYVTGSTNGGLPGQTPVNIQQDGFVRKYDPAGNILWTHEFAINNRPFTAFGVAVDSNGVYVAGKTEGEAFSATSVAVVFKYDSNGNLIWTKQFGASPNGESARAIALSGGAIYVAGQANVTGQIVSGGTVTLRKLDKDGNELWKSQFSPVFNMSVLGVAADSTGAYLAGQTANALPGETFQGNVDGWIIKYDSSGKLAWTHEFGTPYTERVYGVSAGSSGIYIVGSTMGLLGIQTLPAFDFDAFVRKYDANGNYLWTQQFGTIDREEAYGAIADDTGVDVVGWARSGLNIKTLGAADAFVRRYDSIGNPLWTFQTGSVNDDYGYGIAADPADGSLYIGGYSDRNSIPGSPTNAADSFVHKYTPPGASGPNVLEGGIVNNASFAVAPSPVAPGSIAAVFGSGLNDGSVVTHSAFDANGRLVTTLGGTSVTVGGFPAPLFYSLSGQLGIEIPLELAGQSTAQVLVTVGGQTSVARAVNIRAEAPGIFTQTQNGQGTALCVHQDGITVITPDNRAHPGETIICYGTGFGAVSPALQTGQPSAGSQTVTLPKVTIDGLPAAVTYSGLTAGLVGFNQLNIVVPGLARTNAADPLVVTVNTAQSNNVTLPVGP